MKILIFCIITNFSQFMLKFRKLTDSIHIHYIEKVVFHWKYHLKRFYEI